MTGELTAVAAASPLAALRPQPADTLLGLIALHRQDRRADKIDVGVGVYRDPTGATPVLCSVKTAEERLLNEQQTKAYLGAEGDSRFTELLGGIVFGETVSCADRLVGLQTPGGTGALRLGGELLARAMPGRRIWLGDPTWPNHAPIMIEAGLCPVQHSYFDPVSRSIDFGAMIETLQRASPSDILLLHGCCHNPTGTRFTFAQWQALTDFCTRRGLVPFVDLAYQGLGDGLEEDAAGMRFLLGRVETALVAYSCDKNFGLYRERVGALWVQASTAALAGVVRDNLLSLARSLWSMPPDHGAAIVRIILDDAALTKAWLAELAEMRDRLNGIRTRLSAMHPDFAQIGSQRGLFSLLPLDAEAVAALRLKHGIYMAGNGRVNVAGLCDQSIDRFAAAVAPYLPGKGAHLQRGRGGVADNGLSLRETSS